MSTVKNALTFLMFVPVFLVLPVLVLPLLRLVHAEQLVRLLGHQALDQVRGVRRGRRVQGGQAQRGHDLAANLLRFAVAGRVDAGQIVHGRRLLLLLVTLPFAAFRFRLFGRFVDGRGRRTDAGAARLLLLLHLVALVATEVFALAVHAVSFVAEGRVFGF